MLDRGWTGAHAEYGSSVRHVDRLEIEVGIRRGESIGMCTCQSNPQHGYGALCGATLLKKPAHAPRSTSEGNGSGNQVGWNSASPGLALCFKVACRGEDVGAGKSCRRACSRRHSRRKSSAAS